MKKNSKNGVSETLGCQCFTSLLYVAIGVVMLIFRAAAPEIICRILGIGLLVIGIYNVIYHIVRDELLLGMHCDILLIVAGALLTAFARSITSLMAVLLGAFMILKAVFGMQDALISRTGKDKSWIVDLIYAIVTFVMGILLVINPFKGLNYLAIVMGIALVLDGVFGVVVFILNYKMFGQKGKKDACVVDAEVIDSENAD